MYDRPVPNPPPAPSGGSGWPHTSGSGAIPGVAVAAQSGSGSLPTWLGTGAPPPATPSTHDSLAGSTAVPELSAPSGSAAPGPSASGSRAGILHTRERFDAAELAIVCSHFDLGVIDAVKEFRRGSSKSPKVLISAAGGRYLLKRRAPSREGLARVGYCHAIQVHLSQRRFPLPKLMPTRTGNTMLQLGDRIYELFEYVPGNSYDGSLDATGDAGRLLAFFHRLLASFQSDHRPTTASYHNVRSLDDRLAAVRDRIGDPGLAARLQEAYADAAARVERLGIAGWPTQIVHADWHPGNMLFRGSRVVAVIDYDTARLCPRIIDIANGALQFSITMKGSDPAAWPDDLDVGRFKRFCRGYELVKGCVISTAELEALPWLMTEALIVEAALPVAATGHFAGIEGATFLRMVDRKAAWIREHAARLTALIAE